MCARACVYVCMWESKYKYEVGNCDFLRVKGGRVSCMYYAIIFSGVSNVTGRSSRMTRVHAGVDAKRVKVNVPSRGHL